jgi:hypothetical protein
MHERFLLTWWRAHSEIDRDRSSTLGRRTEGSGTRSCRHSGHHDQSESIAGRRRATTGQRFGHEVSRTMSWTVPRTSRVLVRCVRAVRSGPILVGLFIGIWLTPPRGPQAHGCAAEVGPEELIGRAYERQIFRAGASFNGRVT